LLILQELADAELTKPQHDQATIDQMNIFSYIAQLDSIPSQHSAVVAKLTSSWNSWQSIVQTEEWIALELQHLLGASWRTFFESILFDLSYQLPSQQHVSMDDLDLDRNYRRLPIRRISFREPNYRKEGSIFRSFWTMDSHSSTQNRLKTIKFTGKMISSMSKTLMVEILSSPSSKSEKTAFCLPGPCSPKQVGPNVALAVRLKFLTAR
jgi:hypothetical protein